jgi:hypothetical protein
MDNITEDLLAAAKRLLAAMDDYDGNVPASLDSPYMCMKDAVVRADESNAVQS